MPFPRILDVAKDLVDDALAPGATAVDATVGNGHDTVFLARAVGPTGRVLGFDVQAAAIQAARGRLAEAGVADRVTLIQDGHQHMGQHLQAAGVDEVDAVMFNLGYLPGGDKSLITRPDSTLDALEHALRWVRPGGRITVVLYVGHRGGAAEARAVTTWAEALDQQQIQVLAYRFINRRNDPPRLLAFERMAG